GPGEPRSSQQAELGGLVGQAELGSIGAEIAPRMRFEGHSKGRAAVRAAHFHRSSDHGPVAEMNTIEIAHGDHGTRRQGGRRRVVADNGKSSSHFAINLGVICGVPKRPDRGLQAYQKSSHARFAYLSLRAWHVRPWVS